MIAAVNVVGNESKRALPDGKESINGKLSQKNETSVEPESGELYLVRERDKI